MVFFSQRQLSSVPVMVNASIPADTYTFKQPKLSVVRAKRIFFENDI